MAIVINLFKIKGITDVYRFFIKPSYNVTVQVK